MTPDTATLKAALVEALAYLSVLHAGTVDNHYRWTARDLATDLAPLLARLLRSASVSAPDGRRRPGGSNPEPAWRAPTGPPQETMHDD